MLELEQLDPADAAPPAEDVTEMPVEPIDPKFDVLPMAARRHDF
eukprot:SAG11_NODE_36919_length_259_cov_0.700000_1_plen_43_part_10